MGAPRLPFLDAGEHLVEHCAYKRIGEGALHAKRQAAFHVGERFPAKCLAEQDLDARKLVAADGDGEVHLAVEDIAVFGHDNADSAKRRKAHERDLLDARLEDRRREDNREAIGKPCEGARGLLEERIEFRGTFAQVLGDRSVALLVRKRIICEQIVHEGAVPEIGRDATCRGMGLRDVALVFEDRKLVSDGGRAHAELVALGERSRPDGQSARHVFLDERRENALPSI